ncbi:hypothetical protein AVEN_5565-1 [Araneus ventricosus]|uniref:Uncharacterized protein n=1 Tax=Araneus ventricosus TaxID=182803 RepID=A0A4Y2NQE8_ARAVE|nr:hypothetical protein AVEN_5565-1 [Araneus ventricosus]
MLWFEIRNWNIQVFVSSKNLARIYANNKKMHLKMDEFGGEYIPTSLERVKSIRAKCPPAGVVRKFGEGVPAPVSSSSSDAVQNDEIRPKIVLLFLKTGR